MLLLLAFVCIWCSSCLVRLNVFTRDLVVAKRRPVVVWIHGGSFSRFKIVLALTFFMTEWLVFLQRTLNSPRKKNRKKHLWYSATYLEAPRLSMILTTCLTRKLFLSPFNTGSVVASLISQTPRCIRQMWFQVGDVWLPVHRDQGRTRQLWNAWPGLVFIIKQPMT